MSFFQQIQQRIRRDGIAGVLSSGHSVAKNTLFELLFALSHRQRTDADPEKVIWVDPSRIEYCTGRALTRNNSGRHLEYLDRPWYHHYASFGAVLAGDWDIPRVRFESLSEWQLIEDRFVKNLDWEATRPYEHLRQRVEGGHTVFGCSNRRELHERFQYLERVKADMETSGYKLTTHLEPDAIGVSGVGSARLDEVTVDIARDGTVLHNTNGRHRLALAKVLDLPEIPVLVKIRHREWQRRRDQLETGNKRNVYPHPDLADLLVSDPGSPQPQGNTASPSDSPAEQSQSGTAR